MSNPIFSMMQNQAPMTGFMQRLQQFQRMLQGDPKQQVQQLESEPITVQPGCEHGEPAAEDDRRKMIRTGE